MSSITTRLDLVPKPESARLARSALEPVRQFLDKVRFEDLRLMVSELIAEAIAGHSSARAEAISLQVDCDEAGVRASVRNGATAYLLPSRAPQPGEVGWGVYLVQRLADAWGGAAGGGSLGRVARVHSRAQPITHRICAPAAIQPFEGGYSFSSWTGRAAAGALGAGFSG